MREDIRSISSDHWDNYEQDAKKQNMNRSQFHDFLYLRFKKKQHRPTLVEISLLLWLALITVLIVAIR